MESLVTAVVDMYPKVFRRGYRRELLILALSIVSYFLGLVMLTEVSGTEHQGGFDTDPSSEASRPWTPWAVLSLMATVRTKQEFSLG